MINLAVARAQQTHEAELEHERSLRAEDARGAELEALAAKGRADAATALVQQEVDALKRQLLALAQQHPW